MTLSAGTLLGPYRIDALLGAGGMGEVYRAKDTRLDRAVAVKVLPAQHAGDAAARERFEREARLISSLSHPRIAALYDVGEQDATRYLVMELIEGETLADRLWKGPLRIDQALDFAIQIADAMDKAHRGGIVHRDLKPANIMLTEGGVKLLDFGLARLAGVKGAVDLGSGSPTVHKAPLTAQGAILGTVQYMAPEQVEGREADARADIFSFGAVLYEMLSGARAFEGSSPAATMAAILNAEPPPLAAPAAVPPALDHLVRRCLARDLAERWQSAHDLARQLEWIRASISAPAAPAAPATPGTRRRWAIAAAALGALALLALAVVLGLPYLQPQTAPGQLMRFAATLPDGVRYIVGEDFLRSASISPDGQHIVFTGVDRAGIARLYVRPIADVRADPIEGSESGTEPFWSPDSRSIGFYAQGRIRIAELAGGRPRELVEASSTGGASWNASGTIVASLGNPGPLYAIPAAGGTPRPATELDAATELDHDWPQFVGDHTQFLYLARGRPPARSKVWLASLTSPERKLVAEGAGAFAFAPPDHVLYLRGSTLLAQAFDLRGATLSGAPIQLAERAISPFSASRTGAITYRSIPTTPYPLLWTGTDGTPIGEALPAGFYTDPVLSPDGTRLAIATRAGPGENLDIAIVDLASGVSRKITLDPADDRAPVWSPDGSAIVFLSLRPAAPGLYRKSASGVGTEELVLPSGGVVWPYQWTREGLFYFAGVSGANDVLMLPPDLQGAPVTLISTPFNDVDGAISPDGKWFAYTANDSGRWELYLTTFPPSGTKLPITPDGGADPVWARDGSALFYVRPATAELMAMPVTMGDPPLFGAPRRIHAGPLDYPAAHSFDVDPGADRLILAPSQFVQGDINVLLNWQSLRVR